MHYHKGKEEKKSRKFLKEKFVKVKITDEEMSNDRDLKYWKNKFNFWELPY